MELLSSEFHYIVVDGEYSLWINRQTGVVAAKCGENSHFAGSTCLGIVYGYLGKVTFGDGLEPSLVFIRQRSKVGDFKGRRIFKIQAVTTVPIQSEVELILEPCSKHAPYSNTGDGPVHTAPQTDGAIFSPIYFEYINNKTLLKVKSISASGVAENSLFKSRRTEKSDKVEKRILDEFYKMFTEADSFYYSFAIDLTNTIQRQFLNSEGRNTSTSTPLWYHADQRFIWNYHMLNDLIQSKDSKMDRWILPLVQGFIGVCECELNNSNDVEERILEGNFQLWLISRRSRFRAGTRYLKRGIDEQGKVANYVETEQILIFQEYVISFVQIRGSIPLYWSQPGYRYRPPPHLDKKEEESYAAFKLHISEEGSIYGPISIITLVDKSGKEKILGDAYLSTVLTHNSPDLLYLSFDFHDHCRGMHFGNVKLLIEKLEDCFNKMGYSWVDTYGIVLKQKGVFRVNCVDCLDRTNVVQTFIGKHVLQTQLNKLGLLAPELELSDDVKLKLQTLWANNGDCISKQYAGTNALKGDYTRTGTTKLTSALKDGMNSANRYYLNRFRDVHRQAAIDLMLGERKSFSEDELDEPRPEEKENTVEQIKTVIEDARKCIVPKYAVILGSWGLVNARQNAPDEIDIDTIFILTEKCYYSAEYDCNVDSITETEMVSLLAIKSVELGFESLSQPGNFWSLFGSSGVDPATRVPCLRLNYNHGGESYCHEFRSSNIRFFNNVVVPIGHPEEMLEALKMIAESVQVAAKSLGNMVEFRQTDVLPSRPSPKAQTPLSTSWVHRYFSFGQENRDADIENKKSTRAVLSFEKFTPKYFRKGSGTDGRTKTGELKTTINPLKATARENLNRQNLDSTIRNNGDFRASKIAEISSQASQVSMLGNSGDLVLPSCGVISFSSTRHPNIDVQFNSSRSSTVTTVPTVKSSYEISNSIPVTPTSLRYSEPENTENEQEGIVMPSASVLSRHRLSLPVPTIHVDLPGRSVTPEIMITEDSSQTSTKYGQTNTSALSVPTLSKRMSRSTEEITSSNEASGDEATTVQPHQLLSNLKDNRSSSTQSLISSALTMKGSRSENAIVRRFGSVRGGANPLSKESVLVPLGKLARRGMQKGANYFDPRKLKETFKPPFKKEQGETSRIEETERMLQLEKKKSNCKSTILEV